MQVIHKLKIGQQKSERTPVRKSAEEIQIGILNKIRIWKLLFWDRFCPEQHCEGFLMSLGHHEGFLKPRPNGYQRNSNECLCTCISSRVQDLLPKAHLGRALEEAGHTPERVACQGAWIFSEKAGIGFLVEALDGRAFLSL